MSLLIEASQTRNRPERPYWLTDEVATLPYRNIEGIKNVLRIAEGLKNGALFRERTPEELEQVLPKAAEKARAIYSDLRWMRKEENEDWYSILHDGDKSFFDEPFKSSGRSEIAMRVENLAGGIGIPKRYENSWYLDDFLRNLRHNIEQDFQRALRREVIRDITGYERNPYLHMLELYELGAVNYLFFGWHKVDDKRSLVTNFLLKYDRDSNIDHNTVACIIFNSDNSYDKKVQYIHPLERSHDEIRPIKPTRIISY